MSKVLTVRGLQIGAGIPKIIVPIVDNTYTDIIGRAQSFAGKRIDMVEWRADFFEEVFNTERVLHTLAALRMILDDKPLLFTFRSKREGGEKDIPMEAYTALNRAVAQSGLVDLVDVEIASDTQEIRQNIADIRAADTMVVGAYHNYQATPQVVEMLAQLQMMRAMGADIVKVAVMPGSNADVLALLAATAAANEQYVDCPIIAVSLSKKGVISRVAGEAFGSAATFGSVGQSSAPGQIPAEKLVQVLEILHEIL